MTELEFVRRKYATKDIIEVTHDTYMKVIEWIIGTKLVDGYNKAQVDVRKTIGRICEKGFIKFLDEAVIIKKPKETWHGIHYYYYKFRDDGLMEISVHVFDPFKAKEVHPLSLLCKIVVDITTHYDVIQETWNQVLASTHIKYELDGGTSNVGITTIINEVKIAQPQLIPNSDAWHEAVAQEYFRSIFKSQIIAILGLNAYLALLDKEILIRKIEQKREVKAGHAGGKRQKYDPTYRYIVEVPPNYYPRKADLNWKLSEWNRCGHKATRWVLTENAEVLAKRSGGIVLNKVKGKYTAIKTPVRPSTCYRRAKQVDEYIQGKDYQTD